METTRRIHIHLQSNPKAPDVFHMTRERYRAAARRNPDVARRVRCTIATDKAGFYRAMKTANVLVGWWFPRDDLSRAAPKLEWIHIIGAGIEHLLPLDWLPRGVRLVNNRGVHAPKAFEYVTMSLLMLNNAVPALVTNQRNARWQEIFSTTINGKTVAILGVGHMGGTAARSARALGLKVLGIRRSGRPHRYVDEMYRPDRLHEVLPRADFIIVTAPITRETKRMLGEREFKLMKKTAGFLNLGRAEVVDYEALRRSLENGALGGAVLDVFHPEPLPRSSPLWKTKNLIMTPHVASDDRDAYIPRTLDLVLSNVERHLSGKRLKNLVDPRKEY
jgi:phosphoglycerate dehydrogenase-like enzyme